MTLCFDIIGDNVSRRIELHARDGLCAPFAGSHAGKEQKVSDPPRMWIRTHRFRCKRGYDNLCPLRSWFLPGW